MVLINVDNTLIDDQVHVSCTLVLDLRSQV